MPHSKTASRFDSRADAERGAERPSIPPLLLFGCLFWLGSYIVYQLPYEWNGWVPVISLSLMALCLVAIALRLGQSGKVLGLVLCVGLFLGCLSSSVALTGLHESRDSWQELSGSQTVIRITEDVSETDFGYSTYAEAWLMGDQWHWLPGHSIKVKLFLNDESVGYGEELVGNAVFSLPRESAVASYDKKQVALGCKLENPEQLDSSHLGELAKIRAAFSAFIDGLAQDLHLDPSATALLKALVIGERQQLFQEDVYQDVKTCGLAHMVAVSGAHLVIVLGLVHSVLNALKLPRAAGIAVQLLFLGVYLIMVGFPVSCIRASVMAAVGLISFTAHRRSYALSSLGVAMVALIAVDPSSACSLSFALSAFSTLGIVLFTPLLMAWLPPVGDRLRGFVVEPFAMTLAALLFTFPLSIGAFSQFSLVAPLANIVVVPLVSASCVLGVLAFAAMSIPLLGSLFSLGAYAFCLAFAQAAAGLGAVPFASVPVSLPFWFLVVVSLLSAVLLWCVWPAKAPVRCLGITCLALLLCLAVGAGRNAVGTSVCMLDVGQGDAILFKSKGATLLVDTGNQTTKLLSALSGQGVHHLDAIVITHPDDDHCGSLSALRGVVSCDRVFFAKGIKSLSTDKAVSVVDDAASLVGEQNVSELSVGDKLQVGALSLKCVSPASLEEEGGNQDSVVLSMRSDLDADGVPEWSGLFGGDAENEILQSLEDSGAIGEVDILKVSHHGAKAGMTEKLAEELSPQLALISVGKGNRYGHPAQTTLEYLQRQGSQVFRTDDQGTVVCSLEPSDVKVYCMR